MDALISSANAFLGNLTRTLNALPNPTGPMSEQIDTQMEVAVNTLECKYQAFERADYKIIDSIKPTSTNYQQVIDDTINSIDTNREKMIAAIILIQRRQREWNEAKIDAKNKAIFSAIFAIFSKNLAI